MQEHIKESKDAGIRCLVVGKAVAAMQGYTRDGEFHWNPHRDGTATVADLDATEIDTAVRAARTMRPKVADEIIEYIERRAQRHRTRKC